MRAVLLTITVAATFVFVACKNAVQTHNEKPPAAVVAPDTAMHNPVSLSDDDDSLRLVPVFDSALAWVLRQPGKRFHREYDTITDDSLWRAGVSLAQGPLFVSNKTHLQVKVNTPRAVEIRFYERSGDRLRLLLRAETEDPVSDTLRDVNGDGVTDFLLSDYSSSGCCPRERWHVWCYLPATGAFSDEQRFFNATFVPSQKLVRQFGYGHPGEVNVYTLRWQGAATDTLEYFRVLLDRKGYFEQHTRSSVNEPFKVTLRKGLPAAYRSMKGFDWVLDSLDY